MSGALAIQEWQRFAAPRFRTYHYLAMTQGVVAVLAGFEVIIPFALAVGIPPFIAVLLGVLPLAGGMAQLFVPSLLDRTDGNLRGLTIFIAALAEPRGLYLALLAVGAAAGLIAGPLLVVLLAIVVGFGSVFGSIASANLLSWHSAVLTDEERRLTVPRLMAVSLGIGAMLLLPMAFLLDAMVDAVGLYAYLIPFLVAGLFGVAEIFVLRRLRHPGRVIVPPPPAPADVEPTPELDSFLSFSSVNALGMGVAPAMSVFTISVVGLSAGFSMLVASIGTLTMVGAAAFFGAKLAHGSSSRMLRNSFAIRAAAMFSPLLALPATPFAPLFLIASAMLGSIGFASGSLAANERLFRLISGPAVIRHHARYLARTSAAMTVGQLGGATVIALGGPLGYPAFAALYATSASLRVVAFRQAAAATGLPPLPTPRLEPGRA